MTLFRTPVLLSLAALAACAAPATVATPAPSPAASAVVTAPAAAPTNIPATRAAEPPRNWQLLDETADGVPGISAERAMKELLAGRAPQRTVVVAIIDNGIDTTHVDLRANLWSNPKETASNGKDDDNNGYVDDVRGWNFIGGKTGDNVHWDTFEVTRQYAACHGKAAAGGQPPITDAARCKQIDEAFGKQHDESAGMVENMQQASDIMKQIVPVLQRAANTDQLTPERVRGILPTTPQITRARQIYLELASQGATPAVIEEQFASVQGQLKYGLNPDYNPRTVVGDNYSDPSERRYGNADVTGPEAIHGTHVAGIIGAVRGNNVGIDGIAPAVRFMALRAVPDGDERDKDIANAIRYATDNGAQIISMSFGKAYSPYKAAVDDAVKYADAHGVLMVHAAGNDGENLAMGHNFPTPIYLDGGKPTNWIEVGASSWKGGDDLAAPFSNYGKSEVDVFAPGVDVLSTVPGNEYQRESGTSMAAPVVSGLAALIMDYYPSLKAADVKRIIMASVTNVGTQTVLRPSSGDDHPRVAFGTLSVSGGIVNAYNAIKMADEMTKGGKR